MTVLPYRLVTANRVHAEVLAVLHSDCFDEAWGVNSFATALETPGTSGFLAVREDGAEPIGFVLFRIGGGEAEILSIATHPTARGQGVARTLLNKSLMVLSEQDAKVLFLEVGADNLGAIALYKTFGFRETGRRKAYYRRGDGTRMDALVMTLDMPGAKPKTVSE